MDRLSALSLCALSLALARCDSGSDSTTAPPVSRVTIGPSTALTLPTYQEVQARGLVSTAPLHVDIHVYSEVADDRFVFVNMAKQTEGSRLKEGPLVEEIVPEGVILEMNGTRFLLPRD